ncbi:uncharacterized protein KQ657_000743 [Scheffersomyces spartinae]|uniref:NmrA-like domain-containing protein n=1 Tax=Scheffersomyces spartinae TaxID=45513 RepID=A0A9P7V8H8_9ASCO|nr:uncharacterized protein KQ657_000743 [Scheffersomyces spartinae]KAG7193327.1 hypothetical protein KQ657_000743 [Scheffersomyces spartinae]
MKSIAIFGHDSGIPILEALTNPVFSSNFKFPVKVITNKDIASMPNGNVQYINLALEEKNREQMEPILKGIDVIVSTINAPPTDNGAEYDALTQFILDAKPHLYIPSTYEFEFWISNNKLPKLPNPAEAHIAKVRSAGIKTVSIHTGLVVAKEWISTFRDPMGVDAENKTVTYIGEEDLKVSVTGAQDIANVIASLAESRDPEDLSDDIYVESDQVSTKDVAREYEDSAHVTLNQIHMSKEQALLEAKARWEKGHYSLQDYLFMLHVMWATGDAATFRSNDREYVNPGQTFWTWQKFV